MLAINKEKQMQYELDSFLDTAFRFILSYLIIIIRFK